jgi:hypothetical protein
LPLSAALVPIVIGRPSAHRVVTAVSDVPGAPASAGVVQQAFDIRANAELDLEWLAVLR